jgi:protein TonB
VIVMRGKTSSSPPAKRAGTTQLPQIWMRRAPETGVKITALCIAVVLHASALLLNLPTLKSSTGNPRAHAGPIVVKKYVPPPPRSRAARRTLEKKELTRKIPVPDPTPDYPEPIREARVEVEPEPFEPAGDGVLLGVPRPPSGPTAGPGGTGRGEPVLAGAGGVTLPQRIEESYVRPAYPELARLARVEANVVLQAVIRRDGTVDETEVLRCTRLGFGFEEAAVDAVRQWRYRPATQGGVPVDVYFTILVDFALI